MLGWIFVLAIWGLGFLFVRQAWSEGAYYWAAIYVAFIIGTVWFAARSRSKSGG